jgi:hypothetical protein
MAFGVPSAYMGFVGFVKFQPGGPSFQVRATSCDVRLQQEISRPDVIDSRYDRTVYQLGPKQVQGGIEYPAIIEDIATGIDPTARLYTLAIARSVVDGKLGLTDIAVKYTNSFAAFIYKNCLVNTFRYSVTQGDVVTISVDIMGHKREDSPALTSETVDNSRIVMWSDARVNISNAVYALNVTGDYIRSFEANLNNNADFFFTLNNKLEPQDIAPKKRELDGNLVLMGRHPQLAKHALDNQERCTEDTQIQFGYLLTNANCEGTFLVTWPNCVFEIEEIALTNDLFETTINWYCLPNEADLSTSEFLNTG